MPVASPDPRTLMALSAIAYDFMDSIPGAVAALSPTLSVVWGPQELRHPFDPIPYSAAFIARDSDADAYTVVIRGTDPLSWSSWTGEDFDIVPAQPFSQFAANAPARAVISAGTCNGLNDLLQLTDSSSGQAMTILSFLQAAHPTLLYVTGHSLGGTLTPPLFAYLNYQLYGGVYAENMAACSFAALTPGNRAFNAYFTKLFYSQRTWRFYNTLDFAPFCWDSLAGVQNIYTPWNLAYGSPEDGELNPLFGQAASIGLRQPAVGGYRLMGTFDGSLLDSTWVTQALHQHHHTTYLALVNATFANTTTVNFKAIAQPEPASPSAAA